jgi:anti-sigma factor RsiW
MDAGNLDVNCRHAIERFGDYADGELTLAARWRLRLHLWICGHCRRYLRSYRATIAAEKSAFESDAETSNSVPDDLVESILSAAKIPHEPRDPADTSFPKETAE